MQIIPTNLSPSFLIKAEAMGEAEAQTFLHWDDRVLDATGATFNVCQINTSFTRKAGTVRGMHFQRAPWREPKIVRCVRGAIQEAIVDMRVASPTYLCSVSVKLTEDCGLLMYVPVGFAQGFQSLTDNVMVQYYMGEFYNPDFYDGVRFDDPQVAIEWPIPVTMVSEQDRHWPLLSERSDRPRVVNPPPHNHISPIVSTSGPMTLPGWRRHCP
jgi:dTDP-4-dehydrorhamnose 3,5-epimerase